MRGEYCIYCGRRSSRENPVVNGVCLECRIKRGEAVVPVRKTLRYDLCKICGNVKIGYKWMNTHGFEEALSVIVEKEIPRYVKPGDGVSILGIKGYRLVSSANWRTIIRVFFEIEYGGARREVPVDFTVFFNPVKCPRCIMVESGEYEALLQIRGVEPRKLNNILGEEFSRDQRLQRDLIDVVESNNGIDLYFYNYGAARKLARRISGRLGLKMSENYEQVSLRSGKPRARLTIILKP